MAELHKFNHSSYDAATPHDDEQNFPLLREDSTHETPRYARWARKHYKLLTVGYVLTALVCGYIAASLSDVEPRNPLARRAWGGFNERPLTEKCYRQERTAILLAVFLPYLAVDQFFAHHWVLAVFKLLFFCCLGHAIRSVTSGKPRSLGLSLLLALGSAWFIADIVLWVVGGVYGTPGCPGGSDDGWRY